MRPPSATTNARAPTLSCCRVAPGRSCWYGESEERLHNLFKACDRLSMGAIIFMDELDGLVGSR